MITATAACLFYDYILTFEDERYLIWPSHLSYTKLAFFVNRYLPMLATIGVLHTLIIEDASQTDYFDTCKARFLIFSSFVLVEFLVAAFIIYTRAYAVWGCTRPMLVLLTVAYVAFCALATYFAAHFISSVTVFDQQLFSRGCILGLHSCHACLFALIILVISESFALVMILVKASQMPNSTMMQQISEDGIVYYIIVVCTSIANIVILSKAPPTLCDFLLATQAALQSICCNHLMFRIKGTCLSTSLSFKCYTRPHSRMQSDAQITSDDIELGLPMLGLPTVLDLPSYSSNPS
ncbi:uncharacterized protein FOMMEDRAFT_158210 [Fomitiporia mediterranea MF3/22]|uniref:uncharacterized protein n=1 Tax=Fomitiporia mediterranea (strain MF3/22) TaxID=694068 RepID=UPI0004408DDC|nr:uncharacterized protein FOMMEDRAFT_158210 [Fomitiporia mediterranea MF3/22]EJD01077.1 hypothetical protein FOMMEDRAFT_158210 [Fomitiporia mediterranea MF3/22]